MRTLKIAVVGFGLVGKKHAGIVQSNKDLNLCGIVENNEQLLSKIDLKCKNFKSIGELLETEEVDGAIIATPTPLHVAHAKNFVENKIPVLIEKPISNSSKESMSLLDLANKNSTKILVGHHRRHNNIIKSAKKALDNGTIGKIRSASTLCWFYKPDSYFDIAPWRKSEGAGPVSVNLVHDIDLIRHLCGEITQVQAQANPSSRGYDNEDVAAALFIFGNGGIGTVSVSDSIVAPWSWEFTSREYPVYPFTGQSAYQIGGTQGSLSIPDLALWTHDQERDWWSPISANVIDCDRSDPLINQIDHFAGVIRGETTPQVSGCEGLRTLAVIEAIQIAAKTGQTIQLADKYGHQKLAESSRNSENDEANKLNITNLAL